MNISEFLENLDDFCAIMEIPPECVFVSHGGAMLLHGLRETTGDIDIAVNRFNWDRLLGMGYVVTEKYDPYAVMICFDALMVDVHLLADDDDMESYSPLPDYGYMVTTPERMLRDKLALNRPKDQVDIVKLREFLNT